MESDSTTKAIEQASKLTASDRRFLQMIAEGLTVRGAAILSGLSEEKALSVLDNPKAISEINSHRKRVQINCSQVHSDPARVVGINEAYLLSRAKAIELDPETDPKARVAALRFMGEAIGMVGPKHQVRQKDDSTDFTIPTADLARLAAKAGDDNDGEER